MEGLKRCILIVIILYKCGCYKGKVSKKFLCQSFNILQIGKLLKRDYLKLL